MESLLSGWRRFARATLGLGLGPYSSIDPAIDEGVAYGLWLPWSGLLIVAASCGSADCTAGGAKSKKGSRVVHQSCRRRGPLSEGPEARRSFGRAGARHLERIRVNRSKNACGPSYCGRTAAPTLLTGLIGIRLGRGSSQSRWHDFSERRGDRRQIETQRFFRLDALWSLLDVFEELGASSTGRLRWKGKCRSVKDASGSRRVSRLLRHR